MRKQLLLAGLILIGACSHIAPRTLFALRDLDPLTADPADIAVMIDVPDSVAVQRGTAILTFGARQDAGSQIERNFVLARQANTFFVDQQDHADLAALQARIKAWKDDDPDGTTGSISIHFQPCKTMPDIPDDLRGSVAIQLEQDGPFLPLFTDAPLDALLSKESQETMEPCS
ncbi:hypothetical protein ACERZ8_04910 [Tateyamaria armeniaca]|uniref:Lipoprotein n=1 Tax=Tateyamaria armeniaca TaxID=2518930 RepID=A0ABW8UUB4_9RHOB